MKNKMTFICIFFLSGLASCLQDKQESEAELSSFIKVYGGKGNDFGNDLVIPDDQFIFCFGTSEASSGNRDFYLLKTDLNGVEVFGIKYGGAYDETGYAIAADRENGVELVMAGSSKLPGAGSGEMLLMKADYMGKKMFERSFSNGSDAAAHAVIVMPDGGYLLGGYSTQPLTGKDFCLVRTDRNGNATWVKNYGGAGDDLINNLSWNYNTDMQVLIYAYGNTRSYGAGDQDLYLMCLNGQGDSLWSSTYGGTGYEQAGSIFCSGSSIYMGGHTASYGHPEHNAYLVKTDLSGNLIWENNYGGLKHDGAEKSILSGESDCILLAGYSSSYGSGDSDFMLIKVNKETGALTETNVYGTTSENAAFAICQSSHSYFLVGYQRDSIHAKTDLLLVKTTK